MSYSQLRGPGKDRLAKYKQALAANRRQKDNRRGKRKTGIERVDGPGMVRLPPPRLEGEQPPGRQSRDR